jgi:uncharacterized protein with FMN-binding domain
MATMGVLAGGIVLGTGILNGATADQNAAGGSGSSSGGGSTTGGGTSSGGPSTAGAKDGTYTGDTVQTRYGPMQVEIVIKGGKIASAQALQQPGSDRTSVGINSQVIPILVKATTDYQSAQFGNVSRATISSNSYKKSAQSALDQAGFTG